MPAGPMRPRFVSTKLMTSSQIRSHGRRMISSGIGANLTPRPRPTAVARAREHRERKHVKKGNAQDVQERARWRGSFAALDQEIGRASCRESVESTVDAVGGE